MLKFCGISYIFYHLGRVGKMRVGQDFDHKLPYFVKITSLPLS